MTARKVDEHVEVEAEEARAGRTGTGVRVMLIVSTVAVIVGFVAVALFAFN